jgi:chemotaxis protein histidine kinase CheA
MSKIVEVDLQVNSNIEGSISQLKALKKELKNAAVGSEDFKKIYNQIDDLEDKIKSAKKTSSDWVDSLEQAGGQLGALGSAINQVKVSTQSFGGALKATGIGLIVSLVAGLAAAFNDNEKAQKKLQPLLNSLQKIFAGVFAIVEPLFDTFIDLATKALPYVSDAFKVVYSSVTAVFQSLGKLGAAVGKLISGDFSGAWKDAKESVSGFSKNFDSAKNRYEQGSHEMTKTEKENAEKRAEAHEKELARKKAAADKAAAENKARREKEAQEEAAFQVEHKKFLDQLDENAFAGKLAKGKEQASIQQAQNTEIALSDATAAADLAEESGNNSVYLDKKFEELKTKTKKENTQARIELDEKEKQAKLAAAQATADTLGNLANLLGEETDAGKAAAVASATISTFLSAQKAYESTVGIPFVGPILAPINAGIAIAGGLKSVQSILAVKTPNGGGGGAAPNAPTVPSAPPSFNVVGTSGQNQIAQSLGNQAPVKAYVVSNDVTTAQSLDRNIVNTATIGN